MSIAMYSLVPSHKYVCQVVATEWVAFTTLISTIKMAAQAFFIVRDQLNQHWGYGMDK